jgi:hypothetical protein
MNNTKEKIFVNGLKVFKPQVEWVKASISFNKDQFYIWYTEKMNDETLWTKVKRTDYKTGEDMLDKNGKQIFDDYMNIQIQEVNYMQVLTPGNLKKHLSQKNHLNQKMIVKLKL